MSCPTVIAPERDKRISTRLGQILSDEHQGETKYIVGRLLTIIDGVTTDLIQRKAIKDLIEEAVYSSANRYGEFIRLYSGYLAKVLKEKCDWLDKPSVSLGEYNPLTD